MGADGSLRMPPPRLAPGKAGAQMRVLGDRPLELGLGNEPGNKFAGLRQGHSISWARRRRAARRSLDALYAPLARGVTREDDPATVTGRAGGDKVSAVLLHTRAVVDQDEIEGDRLESWPVLIQRAARGGMDELAIPAAIGGAGLLEHAVGTADVLFDLGAVGAPPGHD